MVARQYDVNANLVFTWRKLYGGVRDMAQAQLVPVVETPDPPAAKKSAPLAEPPSADVIEIELPRG
jgi:transposase-like protein